MRTIDEIQRDFQRGVTATVVPLQTRGQVDADGLLELLALAAEGAVALKARHDLPKSFLNELYVVSRLLRAECLQVTDPQVRAAADQLEMIFALILLGEAPSDRKAGIPRIL